MKKSASNFLTRDRFFKRNMRMDETEKKTVYFVDKEDEDEWGALVKYDSELYKRE